MADLTGMTLGPYRIIERIGRGGMATVYKAYHPAMDRLVAIKILPEEFADDPGFRARFEREAKVVANLRHPHILPVFDYGEERNISYLVMPYIPTGTLKEYLAQQGPLPLDEAARIFTRLAEALDYAHRQGVLHRDIKPGNVLFDEEGNALLTDFGLTRMVEGGGSLTGSGVIGTPDYMSPEQGQGMRLDQRSDIYSMGVILYEMVTGEVPFSADTPVAIIFKHVHEPLPLPRSKRPDLPESAENVILKALAKETGQRWSTCVEMAQAFAQAIAGQAVAVEPPSDQREREATIAGIQPAVKAPVPDTPTEMLPARRGFPKWGFGLLVVVAIGVIAVFASGVLPLGKAEEPTEVVVAPTDTPSPTEDFTATAEQATQHAGQTQEAAQATADAQHRTATHIAAQAVAERETQIAQETANAPTNTPRPTVTPTPTSSHTPTATWTSTNTPSPTLDPAALARATRDAELTVTATFGVELTVAAELERIRAEEQTATATLWTAAPTPTATLTPSRTPTATPTLTPTSTPAPPTATPEALADLYVHSVSGPTEVVIPAGAESVTETYAINIRNQGDMQTGSFASLVLIHPDGILVDLGMVADLGAGQTISLAVDISFATAGAFSLQFFADSNDDVEESNETNNFAWVEVTVTAPAATPTNTRTPTATNTPTNTLAPTPIGGGSGQIAFGSNRDGNMEIYLMDAYGNDLRNLTNNSAEDHDPAWSPDGTRIAFMSDRDGNPEIYVMDADGGNLRRLTNNGAEDRSPTWSPDGTQIAFTSGRDSNAEIYVMDTEGGNPRNLTNNSATEWGPAWSPDGTQIAFVSDRDGNAEIYVMDTEGGNPRNLTNNSAWDIFPAWSPDGTQITFGSGRDGHGEIYVMDADGSNPRNLTNNSANDWFSAWSPDGAQIALVSNRDGNDEIYVMDADGGNPRRLTDNGSGDAYPAWRPTIGGETPVALAPTDTLILTATNTPTNTPAPTPIGGGSGQIAFESERDGNMEIYLMDAAGGNLRNLTNHSAGDYYPAWSPDGAQIAFRSHRDGNAEIYVMDADGGTPRRLTNNEAYDGSPAWSPDGTRIAFMSERDGNYEIYVMDADGGNQRRLTSHSAKDFRPAWSPGGTQLAFQSERDGNWEIYLMDADGSNPTRLTNNSAYDLHPAWSPDGTQVVFVSTRDRNYEIYVMDVDGGNQHNLTSHSAWDEAPAWSPDGTQIAFRSNRNGNREIYVMDADGGNVRRLTNNEADDGYPAWRPTVSEETAETPIMATVSLDPGINLQFRAEPDSSAASLGLLPGGTQVVVNGRTEDGSWLQVIYAGQTGWVSAFYVQLTRAGAPLDVGDVPVIGATPVPSTGAALELARLGVTRNADWTPVIQDFDGVEMVLVPAGCFMMGSDDYGDERPIHEQCFGEPFWLDRYEVSQGQLVQFGFENDSYFDGDDLPAETITWFEARDFCALRGARLPNEAEWEYAARGPDGLMYPWGNTFVGDNVVYGGNSNSQTANVGSREGGLSWVGAYDMSGNVWEWISTIYAIDPERDWDFSGSNDVLYSYPYVASDGREQDSDDSTHVRVLRGGSFVNSGVDLRAANRVRLNPDSDLNDFIGFRCARSYP